ncbi:hypothetical protein E2562_035758 [Oryza meyeriana var. granulata]|uniref:Uncharacterized protein n=1 Tax=Oryza meyeriana var. granulata TaxID=110450 RepID=A0A6G1FFI9_9ORYZ|nr:hypothetical protein E2562_035758 [Oryza meyeriana var. granulata]KAF0935730.1 hypothetical protein E2562_035758 [Oryza meyeriana var. granulata]KAF0935762.1 hypothetical protein E2562_035758 [Oryza meyeriana var. granulata]
MDGASAIRDSNSAAKSPLHSVSAGDLGRSTEQHLYLALDDWNGGYRIHRLDADDILDQELAPAAAGGGEHKLPDICCCPVASRSAATTRPPECRMLREKLIRRKEEGPKHFFLSKGKSISLTYMGDGRFALVENILPSEDFNDGAVLHVTLFGLRYDHRFTGESCEPRFDVPLDHMQCPRLLPLCFLMLHSGCTVGSTCTRAGGMEALQADHRRCLLPWSSPVEADLELRVTIGFSDDYGTEIFCFNAENALSM